jgi:hypothetical protein
MVHGKQSARKHMTGLTPADFDAFAYGIRVGSRTRSQTHGQQVPWTHLPRTSASSGRALTRPRDATPPAL